VIAEMIAAEAAQVSDDTSLDDLWEARAYDPQGELQGIGYGYTAAEACAGAWIVACGWPDECHLLDASVALRTSIGSRRMSWPSSSSRSKDHEARPARRDDRRLRSLQARDNPHRRRGIAFRIRDAEELMPTLRSAPLQPYYLG
jgi:hypothetical protein